MAKASDLMGRSGSGGMGGGSPSKTAPPGSAGPASRKHPNKAGGKPNFSPQHSGGGKAPVARRPKV